MLPREVRRVSFVFIAIAVAVFGLSYLPVPYGIAVSLRAMSVLVLAGLIVYQVKTTCTPAKRAETKYGCFFAPSISLFALMMFATFLPMPETLNITIRIAAIVPIIAGGIALSRYPR